MPKDYNVSPYYDDFDETKNFVRMLFNPGRAVQSRELTQLQTILSEQNSKFANHFFKDGSKILGAKIELNQNLVSLTLNNLGGGAVNASDFEGYYVKGVDGGVDTGSQGKIVLSKDASAQIFVAMRGGEFNVTDDLVVVDLDNNGDPALTATISAIGESTSASLSEGIVYINGNFVITIPETILVDADGITGDFNIGYSLSETEITHDIDSTLLDPAQGAYNYNAPGADRYKSTATLKAIVPGNEPTDGTFYAKMFIVGGKIIKEEADTAYADILELLARRTYEINGDFTTDPFVARKADHDTDDTKLNIILDAGIAYVKGFRHETISETTIAVNRSRDYLENTESVWIDQSPYIKLDIETIRNLPAIGNLGEVEFLAAPPVANPPTHWDDDKVLGTARVSGFTFTGTEYRLYLAEYNSMKGNFASVSGVRQKTGSPITAGDFYAGTILEGADDLNPDHTISYSTTGNSLNAYSFEQSVIKTFDTSKFIHRIQRQASISTSGTVATIGTLASEEIDLSQDPIVVDATTGVVFTPTEDYSLASTINELIINFETFSGAILVHYFIEVTGGAHKSKIISNHTDTFIMAADASFVTLSNEDIISITEILDITDTNNVIILDIDNFRLDNGQKDFYYDYGTVSGTFANTKTYTIKYDYYIHGGGGNFFDVSSYTGSGISYDEIPTYQSADTNQGMILSDVVDFRRKVSELTTGIAVPTPRSYMFCEYEYYLHRADLIQIDVGGNFSLLEGTPSLNPVAPTVSDNAMELYILTIPAYTFNASDVNTGYVENKNYTMRDIGHLEQRIGNLEYYSALSLLEKDANDLDITDENGNNVFKNGILVDNFYGGNVVDVNDPEYFCAFDPEQGHLRPVFNLDDLPLQEDNGSGKHDTLTDNGDGTFSDPLNNVRFHPNTITLEYAEVPWVQQGLASKYMNVNPYNVFSWDGDLKLIPDTDYWIDTEYLPDLVTNVDGLYDNLIQKQINAYGTKWGSWKTNWTGTSVTTENLPGHGPNKQVDKLLKFKPYGSEFIGETHRVTTTTSKQSRTGTRLVAVPNRIRKVVGERVVDVSVIPYMRARDVLIEAKNLKPNTNMHCVFNDVDVDAYITPNDGYEPVGSSSGHSIRTDATGKMFGTFNLPNTNTLRFATGQRPFDVFDDDLVPTTFGNAEYLAAGHLQKKQRDVLSISKPRLVTVGVKATRTIKSTKREFVGWYDPVAESFLVEQEGGLFATSIEVFFKSKDASLPVSIMVVSTTNGYPSQNEVPFSNVTLDPVDVNISDDSSVGTTFQFSDPIYLENGHEYAFIVYSNSDAYNIWYAGMGEFDVQQLPEEVRIQEQPYTGVFFKSQNGSTWTADQNLDLKFNINRAKFVTKTIDLKTGDVWFIDDLSLHDTVSAISSKTLTFSAAAKTIVGTDVDFTVFSAGHKVRVGDFSVSNKGDYTVTGVPTASTLTVVEALVNEEPPLENAKTISVDLIQQVDLLATDIQIEIDALVFEFTEIKPGFKFSDDALYSGYMNGAELPLATQKHVSNNINNGTVTKNLVINMYMITENEWVSPVVSRNRSHVVLIDNTLFGWNDEQYNNIWKPLATAPTVDVDGQYYAGVYISKPTTLNNPSDGIKILLDVWKQGASDVEIFFSTGKFSPNYVEIWDGGIDTVRSEMKGEKIYLYNQAVTGDICTYQTAAICTSVDAEATPNRIYLTGVGDPSKFQYNQNWDVAVNRSFVTTEDLDPDRLGNIAVPDWLIGTSYTAGQYVFYNSLKATDMYIWKAVTASQGVAPTVVGTAWEAIPYNEVCYDDGGAVTVGEEIIIDTERTWRPTVLESQDLDEGKATSQFVEYTWIPKDIIEEEFLTFQIKIQLKAKDPAYVPLCAGLRAIATY